MRQQARESGIFLSIEMCKCECECLCKSRKQYGTGKDNNKYTRAVMRAIIENVNFNKN